MPGLLESRVSHIWDAIFCLAVVDGGGPLPFIYLRHFPLALYVLWVTCATTYLGQRLLELREGPWTIQRWFLELPLAFPDVIMNLGAESKLYCFDICLGSSDLLGILRDMQDFFQCEVIIDCLESELWYQLYCYTVLCLIFNSNPSIVPRFGVLLLASSLVFNNW